MKNRKLMVFLLAAVVVLAGMGCASSGGTSQAKAEEVDLKAQFWYITRDEGGIPSRTNQITLRKGENYVYVYFKDGMPGADFDQVQLDFTVDTEVEIFWQAVYDSGVWGSEELVGKMSSGPIATDCSSFPLEWYNGGGNSGFVKSDMRGLVLKVKDTEGRAVFTMKDVTFIGLQG